MTISTFERNATIAEMAVEMDRRGAVIERLEAKISRLTSPPDGVGLTLKRYIDKDGLDWAPYKDAVAALAEAERRHARSITRINDEATTALVAEKARGDDAEAECLRIHNEKVDHFMARVAAEAKAERMEAALREIAEMPGHGLAPFVRAALSVQPEETKP